MTDHNTIDRTREQDCDTDTDLRVTDPPTNQAAGTHNADTYATASQPVAMQAPAVDVRRDDDRRVAVHTETDVPRLDRIRWSSIWAGLAVALALYLFLQLALVAASIVDLSEATSSDAWWSAAAALVAFLIGGIVAGATAVWAIIGLASALVASALGATIGSKMWPRRRTSITEIQS